MKFNLEGMEYEATPVREVGAVMTLIYSERPPARTTGWIPLRYGQAYVESVHYDHDDGYRLTIVDNDGVQREAGGNDWIVRDSKGTIIVVGERFIKAIEEAIADQPRSSK